MHVLGTFWIPISFFNLNNSDGKIHLDKNKKYMTWLMTF